MTASPDFWEANAEDLLRNLAHYSAAGAKEVVDTLPEDLPAGASMDSLFLVLLSFRLVVEATEVEELCGRPTASEIIRRAGQVFGSIVDSQAGHVLELVPIVQRIGATPRDRPEALRRYSGRVLRTQDPDHELFHRALIHVSNYGTTLHQDISAGSAPQ